MSKIQDTQKMLKLRKDAKAIQKKLKNIHIEATDGPVAVFIDAEQSVVKVELRVDDMDPKLKKTLEEALVTAFNKGVKKSQEIAATNMQDILQQMGGLQNMPGMPGADAA